MTANFQGCNNIVFQIPVTQKNETLPVITRNCLSLSTPTVASRLIRFEPFDAYSRLSIVSSFPFKSGYSITFFTLAADKKQHLARIAHLQGCVNPVHTHFGLVTMTGDRQTH